MQKNGQSVRVVDEHGAEIGYTYPKRAKGLVKKCRAEFVSDSEIRLCRQGPTYENMEVDKMDTNITEITETTNNIITVNPKEWQKAPDACVEDTVWARFMVRNPFAGEIESADDIIEVLSLGTWEWVEASRITNGFWQLQPNTTYHFVFWLNGGENDRSDETCQLQILFTNTNVTATLEDFEGGLCYRLNRGYIKPLKKYKGWEYYDISFTTGEKKYTQFQFVAERAPMALMPAETYEVYKDLPDIPDEYEGLRPQRHNIVFEDGWPVNCWYSTKCLADPEQRDKAAYYSERGPRYYGEGGSQYYGERGFTMDIDAMRNDIINTVMESIAKESV